MSSRTRNIPSLLAAGLAATLAVTALGAFAAGSAHAGPFPVDFATWHQVELTTPGSFADELMTDHNGDLWYADSWRDEIVRLDPSGLSATYPLGSGRTVVSMIEAPDGTVWFGDDDRNVVSRLDPAEGGVTDFALPGRFPEAPRSMTIGADGNIWFGDLANGGLRVMRLDGTSTRIPGPTTHEIRQLTTAPDGTIWYAEQASSTLNSYDPRTGLFTQTDLGPMLSDPRDVEISRSGQIWVGCDEGVARIGLGGSVASVTLFPAGSRVTPGSMVAGVSAEMYFTDGEGGMMRIDGAGVATPIKPPFKDLYISTLAVDGAGALWFPVWPNKLGWV